MSNTMFDARELLVPGGAYDRGKLLVECWVDIGYIFSDV